MAKTRECYERHKGNCYCPETVKEATRYGNLARVAADFYVKTGNPAEQDAAYWYARYAFRAVIHR